MPSFTSKSAQDNIYEEIQLLVQENELLLAAAMEQLKPTTADTKIAVQGIFLHDGEKKTSSSANSYLSRASKVFGNTLKSREMHDYSSPPLVLASTFDSESPSDESYASPRSLFGSDHVLSVQGVNHFPLLSVPDIAAMMEEQQQKRSEDKKAQVDREQAEIDEGLKRLHMELEYTDSVPEIYDGNNDDDTVPGPYPPVRKTIQFWDEAEKASSLPSPPQQPKTALVVSNTTTSSPPPSPVRKSIKLWEEKYHSALLSPSSKSSSTVSQPATRRLDASKLLVFENHPKEASGPMDLDEGDDGNEQKSKDKGIGIDTITIPSLSTSTSVSSSESELLVTSDPDLYEQFSRLKTTMLVGTLCILGVIGMIGFCFGSSRYTAQDVLVADSNESLTKQLKERMRQEQREQEWEVLAAL